MRKWTENIGAYLLWTVLLMWLLPFAGRFFSHYIAAVIILIAFVIQMVITYRLRCAWVWLWGNCVYWLLFIILSSHMSGCEGMILVPFFFHGVLLMDIFSAHALLFIFAVCIYLSSFVVQFIWEYRRRKAETTDEAALGKSAENIENLEDTQNEKGVDK